MEPASLLREGSAGLLEGPAEACWTGRALPGGLGKAAAPLIRFAVSGRYSLGGAGAGEGREGGRIPPGGEGLSPGRWGHWAGRGRVWAVGEGRRRERGDSRAGAELLP